MQGPDLPLAPRRVAGVVLAVEEAPRIVLTTAMVTMPDRSHSAPASLNVSSTSAHSQPTPPPSPPSPATTPRARRRDGRGGSAEDSDAVGLLCIHENGAEFDHEDSFVDAESVAALRGSDISRDASSVVLDNRVGSDQKGDKPKLETNSDPCGKSKH